MIPQDNFHFSMAQSKKKNELNSKPLLKLIISDCCYFFSNDILYLLFLPLNSFAHLTKEKRNVFRKQRDCA